MYAVFEDSGRQFKVHENETIEVDPRDLPEGAGQIEFDKVLLIGDEQEKGATKVGQPWVEGAKVVGRIDGPIKGEKITVLKFRRRKGYRRKQGHTQPYLKVTIDKIMA